MGEGAGRSATGPTGRDGVVRAALDALVADPPRVFGGRVPGDGSRPAAVLMLFGVLDRVPAAHETPLVPADLDVLLTRRSPDLSHHPGQIAFPGGGIDADDDGPVAAALREAQEETGLDPAGVEVVGTWPAVALPASGNVVTPVVGWWRTPSPVWAVDPVEATEVFRAPVADLVDPARRYTAVISRRGGRYAGPAFDVAGHVVWGFTGHLLDAALDRLGWAEPWDRGRTIPAPAFP